MHDLKNGHYQNQRQHAKEYHIAFENVSNLQQRQNQLGISNLQQCQNSG